MSRRPAAAGAADSAVDSWSIKPSLAAARAVDAAAAAAAVALMLLPLLLLTVAVLVVAARLGMVDELEAAVVLVAFFFLLLPALQAVFEAPDVGACVSAALLTATDLLGCSCRLPVPECAAG
jgi:hypothetical protein